MEREIEMNVMIHLDIDLMLLRAAVRGRSESHRPEIREIMAARLNCLWAALRVHDEAVFLKRSR